MFDGMYIEIRQAFRKRKYIYIYAIYWFVGKFGAYMYLDVAPWKIICCEYSVIHFDILRVGSQFKCRFARGIYVIGNMSINLQKHAILSRVAICGIISAWVHHVDINAD